MNSLSTFAARQTSRRIGQQVRPMGSKTWTGDSISLDVDHYSSGWNIGDIEEFTKAAGKYQIQTFNKISEKVRRFFSTDKASVG